MALAEIPVMLNAVKATTSTLACLTGILFLAGTPRMTRAEVKPNPYQPIIERNASGLKPPPPPPDNTPPPPPPTPPPKVILTGITSMFGPSSKRALLEITEQEQGKTPNTKKPILREGERDGLV